MVDAKIILGILLIFIAACSAPPEDADRADVMESIDSEAIDDSELITVPADEEKSYFEFEGFGPGKSHVGSFEEGTVTFYKKEGRIVGVEGMIDAASVNTGIEGLDNHLRSEDFFDVQNYPNIIARYKNLDRENGQITGDLTFLGVTKEITFPATITDNSVEADFVLDMSQFGLSYTGVNPEVAFRFKFVAQE